MIPFFFSALPPLLLLVWLFQKLLPKEKSNFSKSIALFFIGLLAAGILLMPVQGLSVARWSASFLSSFSIPLIGLLAISVVEEVFSKKIFSSRDWKAAWLFGAGASLLLYPSALGLGRSDTYSWGWRCSVIFIGVALIAIFLLWKKNRFGILLLLALAAFDFHIQETTNFWDYVIDPIYGGVALVMLLTRFFRSHAPMCDRS